MRHQFQKTLRNIQNVILLQSHSTPIGPSCDTLQLLKDAQVRRKQVFLKFYQSDAHWDSTENKRFESNYDRVGRSWIT